MPKGQVQVLLADAIPNLGAEADIVDVKRGFARNYLIPQGKAYELNPQALRHVKDLKAKRAEREQRELKEAEEFANKLNNVAINMELLTGEQGKAFGSITSQNIYDELQKQLGEDEVTFDRHALQLDGPIKSSGTHEVPVKIHPEVTATIHVNVKAKGASERALQEAQAETMAEGEIPEAAAEAETAEAAEQEEVEETTEA
jgi:large subunit ribosomal protein L9